MTAFAILLLAAAAPEAPTRVAVLEMAAANVDPATVQTLGEFFTARVQELGFSVITTSEVATLLGYERQRQLVGCEESSCIAEIAGALGVDLVATGSVGKVGDTFVLTLKVLDARKGLVVGRASETADKLDALFDAIRVQVPRVFASRLPAAPAAAIASVNVGPDGYIAHPVGGPLPGAGAPGTIEVAPARKTWPAWTTLAAGVALSLGGVYSTMAHQSAQSDYQARFENEGVLDDALRQRSASFALAANVLFGAGATACVAGTVLFFWP